MAYPELPRPGHELHSGGGERGDFPRRPRGGDLRYGAQRHHRGGAARHQLPAPCARRAIGPVLLGGPFGFVVFAQLGALLLTPFLGWSGLEGEPPTKIDYRKKDSLILVSLLEDLGVFSKTFFADPCLLINSFFVFLELVGIHFWRDRRNKVDPGLVNLCL